MVKSFSPIRVVYPESFDSTLTETILQLESLRQRHRHLDSNIHPVIYLQLRSIFHTLESISSVHIEGNNTTVAEYVERSINEDPAAIADEKIKEIENIRSALSFIDETVDHTFTMTNSFIHEVHSLTVEGLDPKKDGDKSPGRYSTEPRFITNSSHTPPMWARIDELMTELLTFLESITNQRDHLLSIAIFHHRFVWIHPFNNGNGRVVRLLTYAMLQSQGFSVRNIINPTAVFCNQRQRYYDQLAHADSLQDEGILSWCEFVLNNLLEEMHKIDRLLNENYIYDNILYPALKDAVAMSYLTEKEMKAMKIALEKGEFMAKALKKKIDYSHDTEITRLINTLKDKKMIQNAPKMQRKYIPRLHGNYLMRSIIKSLEKESFIPSAINETSAERTISN